MAITDEIIFIVSSLLMLFFVEPYLKGNAANTLGFTILGIYVLGMAKNLIVVIFGIAYSFVNKFRQKPQEVIEPTEQTIDD